MMFPDPQQFLADFTPPRPSASPSDASPISNADLMPAETDLEDWALQSLYTCDRCRAILPNERMLRYCPRCGYQVAIRPLPGNDLAALEELAAAERQTDDDGRFDDGDFGEDEFRSPDVLEPAAQPTVAGGDAGVAWSRVTRADIEAMIGYWQAMLACFPEEPRPDDGVDQSTSEFEAALRGELAPIPFAGVHHPSSIVTAYASALYRLGKAYETRLGAEHNVNEASRCFYKAARLGNPDAINRLHADETRDTAPVENLHT